MVTFSFCLWNWTHGLIHVKHSSAPEVLQLLKALHFITMELPFNACLHHLGVYLLNWFICLCLTAFLPILHSADLCFRLPGFLCLREAVWIYGTDPQSPGQFSLFLHYNCCYYYLPSPTYILSVYTHHYFLVLNIYRVLLASWVSQALVPEIPPIYVDTQGIQYIITELE